MARTEGKHSSSSRRPPRVLRAMARLILCSMNAVEERYSQDNINEESRKERRMHAE